MWHPPQTTSCFCNPSLLPYPLLSSTQRHHHEKAPHPGRPDSPPPPPAFAQFGDAYVALNLGTGSVETASISAAADGTSFTVPSEEESDTLLGVTAGYKFSDNLAIEGGLYDLGEYSIDHDLAVAGAGTASGLLASEIELTGVSLAVVGILPVSRGFDLYGKAGILSYSYDVELSVPEAGVSVEAESDDANELFFGVGGKFDLGGGSIELGVEYLIYQGDDEFIDSGNILSAVLSFYF